mmetsp:Transcript_73402/g.174896  ORF Transcript_73402/g.174896 Transcript_73402/m.174896 type:complete len:220 (-) Transcript_73402:470-1129(-)
MLLLQLLLELRCFRLCIFTRFLGKRQLPPHLFQPLRLVSDFCVLLVDLCVFLRHLQSHLLETLLRGFQLLLSTLQSLRSVSQLGLRAFQHVLYDGPPLLFLLQPLEDDFSILVWAHIVRVLSLQESFCTCLLNVVFDHGDQGIRCVANFNLRDLLNHNAQDQVPLTFLQELQWLEKHNLVHLVVFVLNAGLEGVDLLHGLQVALCELLAQGVDLRLCSL